MTFIPSTVRRERMRQRSKVEEEILKSLSEGAAIAEDGARAKEVAEPGFESPSADRVLDEDGEEPGAVAKTGEQMPEDDEGEYPDEELEVERTDLSTESGPPSEEAPPSTSAFRARREEAQQA
jgi:hypothetical protein